MMNDKGPRVINEHEVPDFYMHEIIKLRNDIIQAIKPILIEKSGECALNALMCACAYTFVAAHQHCQDNLIQAANAGAESFLKMVKSSLEHTGKND